MAKKLSKTNIWNQLDEIGLLTGLGVWTNEGKTLDYVRYPGENNKQLRDRILKNTANISNSTHQGLLNTLTNNLNIGDSNLELYNVEDKKYFYLSEEPYPSPSGIRVYVSSSGSWSDSNEIKLQVRASGYANALSGWIVWNLNDLDYSLIPSGLPGSSGWFAERGKNNLIPSGVEYGKYTQILEFIGSTIPETNDNIRVDYQIQTSLNIYGEAVLNWRSDFSHPDDLNDERFIAKKSEFPATSGDFETFKTNHISIFTFDDLKKSAVSGYFYDTNGKPTKKLLEIGQLINENYPLQWGSFRYDIARWDQLEESSVGSIPSFHDVTIPSGVPIKGGSKYGIDLDFINFTTPSGNRDSWYPILQPGEFYIGNDKYYLFGNMQYENLTLTDIGNGILSGQIVASGVDAPMRLGQISAYSSGVFFPNNTYFKYLHDSSNVKSGVYYRNSFVNYKNKFDISELDFNDNNFYFDYDTGNVYASGINPTGFILTWEHTNTYISGCYVTYSGGYGLNSYDFNPLKDIQDKILYFGN